MTREKRKNLKPAERRAQFVQVAQYLFFTKGFDDTTMADIIKTAGVSKGGFYHHFKSKDELLFAVLDSMAEIILSEMETITGDPNLTGIELLHRFIHLRSDYLKKYDYPGQVDFFSVMNEDKNIALLEGFKRRVIEKSMPMLVHIIEKGCDEGNFSTASPKIAASMILYLSSFFDGSLKFAIDARGTSDADAAAIDLQAAIDMQFLTIDRILGLPDGTTNFGWPDAVKATMATVPIHSPNN